MNAITIQPGQREGNVEVPWSKSHLHRLLISDFLAGEHQLPIDLPAASDDVLATRRCLDALAGNASFPVLDCGESGSTLRFLLPVSMVCRHDVQFTAAGRLPERPVAPFLELLERHGVTVSSPHFPLHLTGTLSPGVFTLPGNISSQIITGLLFALPLLPADSRIELTTPLESRGYVDMTLAALRDYGIAVTETTDGYLVHGRQRYRRPAQFQPERDWSGAAFWLTMNHLGSRVQLDGLNMHSAQPDRAICQKLDECGGATDVSQCPDLFPVLAIAAGAHRGQTRFTGVRRLRLKESDRLAAMAEVLAQFGVETHTAENAFTVIGIGPRFHGHLTLSSFGDHRIAMAAAVGATIADGPVAIQDTDCVSKSYPGFFSQFLNLRQC